MYLQGQTKTRSFQIMPGVLPRTSPRTKLGQAFHVSNTLCRGNVNPKLRPLFFFLIQFLITLFFVDFELTHNFLAYGANPNVQYKPTGNTILMDLVDSKDISQLIELSNHFGDRIDPSINNITFQGRLNKYYLTTYMTSPILRG
jgi:hypothetical protein